MRMPAAREPVERERLWDFLMDVPSVGRCVPGVETIEAVNGSAYKGGLKIHVGPIRLSLEGAITVEEADRAAWRARMRAEANDRRLGLRRGRRVDRGGVAVA